MITAAKFASGALQPAQIAGTCLDTRNRLVIVRCSQGGSGEGQRLRHGPREAATTEGVGISPDRIEVDTPFR